MAIINVYEGESINKAIKTMISGDTINIWDGIYNQNVSINKPGIQTIWHNVIIDGEYQYPIGDIARLDPRSDKYHVWEGLFDIVASDVVIEGNLEVKRSLGRGVRIFDRINNVKMIGVNVNHIRGAGILVNHDTEKILLEDVDVFRSNNYAPYSRSARELDWGGGFSIMGKNISLFNCRAYENWGEGILVFGRNVEDIKILGSQSFDNYALQLYIDHGIGIRIRDGKFYFENPEFFRGGKPPTTIAITNEDWLGSSHKSEDIEITDSEFWGGSYHFGLWSPIKDVLFTRNTLRDATEGVFQSFGSPNENVRITENEIYHEDESKIFVFESDEGIDYSGNIINPDPDPDPTHNHKEILDKLDKLEVDQAQMSSTLIAQEGQIEDLVQVQGSQNKDILDMKKVQYAQGNKIQELEQVITKIYGQIKKLKVLFSESVRNINIFLKEDEE